MQIDAIRRYNHIKEVEMKKTISLEHAAELIERALAEVGKESTFFTVADLEIIRKAIELAINENEK